MRNKAQISIELALTLLAVGFFFVVTYKMSKDFDDYLKTRKLIEKMDDIAKKVELYVQFDGNFTIEGDCFIYLDHNTLTLKVGDLVRQYPTYNPRDVLLVGKCGQKLSAS